jgi:hypothetical protein
MIRLRHPATLVVSPVWPQALAPTILHLAAGAQMKAAGRHPETAMARTAREFLRKGARESTPGRGFEFLDLNWHCSFLGYDVAAQRGTTV